MLFGKGKNYKIIIIVVSVFTIRLFFSCCDCPNSLTYFDYERVDIKPVNNSGIWITSDIDTIKSEAVAFEVAISSNDTFFYSFNRFGLGFEHAYGVMCDCAMPYKAKQFIDSLKIRTIYNLTEQIVAGSDVTEQFVAYAGRYRNNSGLYISINKLIEDANNAVLFNTQAYYFYLFLKPKIDYNTARFSIDIYLSDKRVITELTPLITIF